MTEHIDKLSAAAKRPLKVFPSTGSGLRLCHAHADRDAVRALSVVERRVELVET